MGLEDHWLVVAGAVVAPYVVSYLKADAWPAQRKRLFAVVVSLALGVAAFGIDNGWDAINTDNFEVMLASGGGVWFLGQIVYDKLVGGTALEVTFAETKGGILPTK